jgi:hypothetical protein
LVVATSSGKVFGIDSDGGHIVWSRYLEEAMSGDVVTPLKLFTTVSISDGKEPEVVLLANQETATVSSMYSLIGPKTQLYLGKICHPL